MNTVYIIITAVIAFVIGTGITYIFLAKLSKTLLTRAKDNSEEILKKANLERETIVKNAEIDGKELVYKLKIKAEDEIKNKKRDLDKFERKLLQKSQGIDRKSTLIEAKEMEIRKKEKELSINLKNITREKEEIEDMRQKQISELEKISKMTSEEAKEVLFNNLVNDAKRDSEKIIKDIIEEAKHKADVQAKKVIAVAVQKNASEYAEKLSVSIVNLPNDEMKGRIIGREGRNIRTLENLTGVDLIIDDTPEAVIISCYDSYKREIAVQTLERLLSDGRIHPARIEETVEKVQAYMQKHIVELGESAAFKVGIPNIPKELIKLLGKLHYRTSYSQNVLEHSIEVAMFAGSMAAELGINAKQAKRAGLLHDIGKAVDQDTEGTHAKLGAEILRKYREDPMLISAVEAHHDEAEHQTVESVLIQAADALSAARPGARKEILEIYLKRISKLEEIPKSFEGVTNAYAISAGRELRIIVEKDTVDDQNAVVLARDIAKRIERDVEYPGQIKVTVIRESRAVEYAN